MPLIQTRALHNWNVRIGLHEKVVRVDKDLRVVYMEKIFLNGCKERHDCEGKFSWIRRKYNYRTTEYAEENSPEEKPQGEQGNIAVLY